WIRRKTVEIDLAAPGEKRKNIIDLLIVEVVIHHLALARIHLLGIFEEDTQIVCAFSLHDLGQFWCVVGAFTKQGVTTHAVVLLPKRLTGDDLRRQLVLIRHFRNLTMRVVSESQKRGGKHARPTKKKRTGL